jgi:hypothetical protein
LDPFDGYITYRLLNDYANNGALDKEIKTMEKIVRTKYPYYSSDDPLDLGEALWISHFYPNEEWSQRVSSTSINSLEQLYKGGEFDAPTRYRLAFREFGTTIGVQVNKVGTEAWHKRAANLNEFWNEHIFERDRDITPIMYCTSLIPGAFEAGYVERHA